MPSKNSINRPKLTTNLHHKANKLGVKRQQRRETDGLVQPSRSSKSSKSGEIKSIPLDLYFHNRDEAQVSGATTTKTLSKKRAKKIERNLKYAEQRKLLTDLQSKMENGSGNDMEVDSANKEEKRKKNEKKTNLTLVKDALWNIIEDTTSQGLMMVENGQGTTLGSAFFP